jgi:hypothetical protein
MSLAGLYNIPETETQLAEWSFINAAAHADINRVILQRFNVIIPSFVLDPIDPRNMQAWLYQHQQMHSDMDFVLGIQGFDLTDVNWQDQSQFAGWIQSHAAEHMQAGQILNLG